MTDPPKPDAALDLWAAEWMEPKPEGGKTERQWQDELSRDDSLPWVHTSPHDWWVLYLIGNGDDAPEWEPLQHVLTDANADLEVRDKALERWPRGSRGFREFCHRIYLEQLQRRLPEALSYQTGDYARAARAVEEQMKGA